MTQSGYKYVIIGGGVAGAYAVEGIREVDHHGPILIIGDERFLPYDRPPLSKKLWTGKDKIEDVFVHDEVFYSRNRADIRMGVRAVGLDPSNKTVATDDGRTWHYEKCLLATGSTPRRLDIPGADLWDVCYYRYLGDYLRMEIAACEGKSAVVIGGGFIGSELAAALRTKGVDTTMIFPDTYVAGKVFPEGFARFIQDYYREKGVRILNNDSPVSFEKKDGRFLVSTQNARRIQSDILVVGAGVLPNVDLAKDAGLEVSNGVVVDETLRTSDPDIYAAGDIAFFPYAALGVPMRVEHWDNALNQGKHAGRNMAGVGEPYYYMPYFWSDLFDYGYEAIGDVNSSLETSIEWVKPNDVGVIYYLKGGEVVGVMTVNMYGRMDAVRAAMSEGEPVTPDDLRPILVDEKALEVAK